MIFSKNDFLSAEDFRKGEPLVCGSEDDTEIYGLDYREARKKILLTFNVEYITRLLRRAEGNVSLAAQTAGIERQSLQHIMRKYGITSGEFRKEAEKK
ncbi:MAG TPA: hypothetical protein DCP92_09565 [Nitrospiraceae bacterium]|nr:hypothetical protein [Nitrospiraceae bacterium]